MKIAVVGAGWAGLTAAHQLASNGHHVALLEQSPILGGRARAATFKPEAAHEADQSLLVDNGQHLLMGAYSKSLELIRKLGAKPEAFDRFPVFLQHSQGFKLQANRWPAPFHLMRAWLLAQGLSVTERIALVYFLGWLKTHRWLKNGWASSTLFERDLTVAQLLQLTHQPRNLIRVLWRPLCLSALNTPPEQASAKVFAAIMRDTLGAKQADSDFIVAKHSLGELLPDGVASFLQKDPTKHQVVTGFSAATITKNQGWKITSRSGQKIDADAIVLATPWESTSALLASANLSVPNTDELTHLPIVTVYLYWRTGVHLTAKAIRQRPLMLNDDAELQNFGQWFFDLGPTAGGGHLGSVVISGPGRHEAIERKELAQLIATQVTREIGWIHADSAWAITEKRATFACTAGLRRPQPITDDPSVQLCGDYFASEYPATLETAVRSGLAAADKFGINK